MADDKKMVVRNKDRRNASPLGPWEDLDDIFDAFRRDIDSMFFDPWGRGPVVPKKVRIANRAYMPMDMKDEGENLSLTVEMPGVKKDDVKMELDEDLLTISVDSQDKKEEKEEGYLLRERSSFSCKRSVRLPSEVKGDDVDAKMKDGVLHVKLPKVHPKKKKVHEIKVA